MTEVDIAIRDIDGQSELRAVEELQKQVWGLPDLEVVPLTQLVAARASGGVLLGAFDENILIGFAYGFVGFENGRATHHSHMLAVKPEYRGHRVGYRLKLAQRNFVMAEGIREMTWTFDPLQSMNAYFNFDRLGVVSNRYLIDFYGTETASFLHRNGTDRLWATWQIMSRRVTEKLFLPSLPRQREKGESLVELAENDAPRYHDVNFAHIGDVVFIEIPAKLQEIEQRSLELAADWRMATRMAFTKAIDAGFVIVDFLRGDSRGTYVLSRNDTMKGLAV